jgi:hypothetical protein
MRFMRWSNAYSSAGGGVSSQWDCAACSYADLRVAEQRRVREQPNAEPRPLPALSPPERRDTVAPPALETGYKVLQGWSMTPTCRRALT